VKQEDFNKRRALIVRRQAAYRAGQRQREIWRKRREDHGEDVDEGAGEDDLIELPEGLLG
jgi:hypothetical protein